MEDIHKLFLSFPLFGSHLFTEGHLPGYIPLSYIDKIIIQKRKYEVLRSLQDPTIESFFNDFCSKTPGNLIQVDGDDSNIVDRMHKALWEVCDKQILLPTSPSGFTFTVSPSLLYNIDIPLKNTFDRCVISFSVVGGSFSLYLSNFPGIVDPDDPDDASKGKNMLYMFFDHLSGEISTRSIKDSAESVGPSCQLYNNDLKSLPGDDDTLSWDIYINNEEKSIRCSVFSHKHVISLNTDSMIPSVAFDRLRYISFAPYLKEYTIWNLRMNEYEDGDVDGDVYD